MPSRLDKCVKAVNKKIKQAKIGKTYKCDSKGNPNKKGKHRCKTNAWAICKSRMKRR